MIPHPMIFNLFLQVNAILYAAPYFFLDNGEDELNWDDEEGGRDTEEDIFLVYFFFSEIKGKYVEGIIPQVDGLEI